MQERTLRSILAMISLRHFAFRFRDHFDEQKCGMNVTVVITRRMPEMYAPQWRFRSKVKGLPLSAAVVTTL